MSLRSVTCWIGCAAAMLLAGSLAAPAEARASCGDWLDHGAMQDGPAANAASSVPGEPQAPQSGSCQGPSCSRAPVAPPQPAPRITSSADHWACLAGLISPPPRSSAPKRVVAMTVRPLIVADGVFRPPRPVTLQG